MDQDTYNTALLLSARLRSLRLEAQDIALSRLEHGFESRRERHKINDLQEIHRALFALA